MLLVFRRVVFFPKANYVNCKSRTQSEFLGDFNQIKNTSGEDKCMILVMVGQEDEMIINYELI